MQLEADPLVDPRRARLAADRCGICGTALGPTAEVWRDWTLSLNLDTWVLTSACSDCRDDEAVWIGPRPCMACKRITYRARSSHPGPPPKKWWFCSPRCSIQWHAESQAVRNGHREVRTCQSCGDSFISGGGRPEGGGRRYCSTWCYEEAKRYRNLVLNAEISRQRAQRQIICPDCGRSAPAFAGRKRCPACAAAVDYPKKLCIVEGCSYESIWQGLCKTHQARQLRYGSPTAGPPIVRWTGRLKLTPKDAAAIRRFRALGLSYPVLAEIYGVAPETIRRYARGENKSLAQVYTR